MKILRPIVLALCMSACCTTRDSRTDYRITPSLFNIDDLTDDQRRIIREGHETDTSSYLTRSRPVLFQIVRTPNNANETRGPSRFDQEVDVLVYGLGEAHGSSLVDQGCIEDVETGTRAWEMTYASTSYAGGAARNRKKVSQIRLPPGVYRLRYRSNATHAYASWEGKSPEYDHLYGVTMFNMTALPDIERRPKKEGLPPLSSSLKQP